MDKEYESLSSDLLKQVRLRAIIFMPVVAGISIGLAFFRESNTSQSVIDVYEYLDQKFGRELFQKLFPIILTDNGSEFSNLKAIEYGTRLYGKRTQLYYCGAGCPHQKGSIEVNHSLIHLIQEEITRMMNHINSYKRKKLNNRSPYETFSFYHGEEVLHKLGWSPVPADDILLKPTLLKR